MRILPLDETAVARIALDMRPADRAEIFAQRWSYDPLTLAHQVATQSRLGAVGCGPDGIPIAAVMALHVSPAVLSVGLFATTAWPTIAIPFSRWCVRSFKPLLLGTGARRAECWSQDTHAEAHAWLRWFGFVPETPPIERGPAGERFVLFGWGADHVHV